MAEALKLRQEVSSELRWIFAPPRTVLQRVIINGIVSLAFFMFSLVMGTNNQKLLPFAATVMLLWTFADASLTNQLMVDRERPSYKNMKSKRMSRFLIVNNLTVVVLSIPVCILFGLIMVAIVGKWSELILGVGMALALIWGWLGIANVLSVMLPFQQKKGKELLSRGKGTLAYIVLYCLPWIMLPVYAGVIILPLLILHWVTGDAAASHKFAAFGIILVLSLAIWLFGLQISQRYIKNPNAKIWDLIN